MGGALHPLVHVHAPGRRLRSRPCTVVPVTVRASAQRIPVAARTARSATCPAVDHADRPRHSAVSTSPSSAAFRGVDGGGDVEAAVEVAGGQDQRRGGEAVAAEVAALPDVGLARVDEGADEGAPVERAAAVAAAVRAHQQQWVVHRPSRQPGARRGQRELEQFGRARHGDHRGVGARRGGVGEVEPHPVVGAAAAGAADELEPETRRGGAGGEPDDRRVGVAGDVARPRPAVLQARPARGDRRGARHRLVRRLGEHRATLREHGRCGFHHLSVAKGVLTRSGSVGRGRSGVTLLPQSQQGDIPSFGQAFGFVRS